MAEGIRARVEDGKKFKEGFEFLKVIGEGSFSTVHLVKDKKSSQLYANNQRKKVKYVHLEKRILAEFLNNHPFFVKLCFTFQDEDSLYFGLSYCSNGDLLNYIKKFAQFDLKKTQFYSAEIVDALEYMHSKQIVHRDLKPENILLDDKFHIKLTDFGTARIINEAPAQPEQNPSTSNGENKPDRLRRRNSFVGTAQFVAPEILNGKEPHIGCDLWALGCIIYQMLTGKHLFTGNHEYDIFQKIIKLSYTFPDGFDELAQSLIQKLVVTDPNLRLGAQSYDQLKADKFFESISWTNLSEQTPPE